jgi:hypothetical protein
MLVLSCGQVEVSLVLNEDREQKTEEKKKIEDNGEKA